MTSQPAAPALHPELRRRLDAFAADALAAIAAGKDADAAFAARFAAHYALIALGR